MSFRFVSFQSKGKPPTLWGCTFYDILITSKGDSALDDTFRNFNRSLNKRRMSPALTIKTEWTAEKWVDKRLQSKQTSKHKLGNRTNRWSKVQADARRPSSKKQFKQRQRQRRLKNDLIFNLRISREFRFIQFVQTVRNIPNRICKTAETASKFEKRNFKNSPSYSSRSL